MNNGETVDRRTLEEMRRGLIKEIEAAQRDVEATKEQIQGKRAQLNAIERHLDCIR